MTTRMWKPHATPELPALIQAGPGRCVVYTPNTRGEIEADPADVAALKATGWLGVLMDPGTGSTLTDAAGNPILEAQ